MTVSVSAVVAIVGISCGFSISFSLGGGISHGGEKSNCESEILHIDYQAIGFVRRTEALQRQQAYLYQKFFGLGGVRSLPEISMQVTTHCGKRRKMILHYISLLILCSDP